MQRRIKIVLASVVILVLLGLVGGAWLTTELVGSPNHESAVRTTLEWARLVPLPAEATALDVSAKGSAFTREFVVHFSAPEPVVQTWLNASPGTSEVKPEILDDGSVHYLIKAGKGAQFAEVTWSKQRKMVAIRAYWS